MAHRPTSKTHYCCSMYLCHCCEVFTHPWQGCFIAYLKIHVYQLVAEGRELVGETGFVLARHVSRPCVGVVLLLHLFVDHILSRISYAHVNIVMATSDNLNTGGYCDMIVYIIRREFDS
jgi:hypothetical protein